MTQPERRRSPRIPLSNPTYISFGTTNGGIISNVSATGLAFCAAVPIPQSGAIRFSFSRRHANPLDCAGEMVWRDETQRKGGLKFTLLPKEAWQILGIQQVAIAAPEDDVVERLKAKMNLTFEDAADAASTPVPHRYCPKCGSTDIRKSRREGLLERHVFPLLRLRPYRCIYCYRRFFRT